MWRLLIIGIGLLICLSTAIPSFAKPLSFSHGMLRGRDFSGQELAGSGFANANMEGANFSHADLRGRFSVLPFSGMPICKGQT